MPITTMDQLIAALPGQRQHYMKTQAQVTVAGQWSSLWDRAGRPGAGSFAIGNVAAGVIPTKATAGAIPFTNPVALLKNYLASLNGNSSVASVVMLYDRLWHAGSFGLGALGAQALAGQPALTRPDAAGEDAEIWLEIASAFAAGATTIEVTYTNSLGVAGRTTGASAPLASVIIGRMFPMPLQAGDTGVQKIESIIVGGATNTGTVNVLLLRKLAQGSMPAVATGFDKDSFALGLPEISPDACLAVAVLPLSTSSGTPMLELGIATG